ncbi:MAG: S8 family peptidase [Streptosporangiaceae bacterium]
MPEPNMNWYFQPPRHRDGASPNDSAPGLITLPPEVLQRHGARVLDPETAVAVAGYRPPRSTVYRARTLLVPLELQQDPTVGLINAALRGVGMKLLPSTAGHDTDHGNSDMTRLLAVLPRPAVLVATEGEPKPMVIDAWVALQALRAAAASPPDKAPDQAGIDRLYKKDVDRIALEHLLVGSAITGSPAYGGGGLAGNPGSDNGGAGPTSTDSYLFSGGDTRTPVAVLLDAPRRTPRADCVKKYGRRPVIAVVDTGVRAHPWLNVAAKPGGGYDTDPENNGDGFIEIDDDIQKAIWTEGEDSESSGDQPRQVIRRAWDTPITENPLIGELGAAEGHGTFIAGIVRQVAPDARVLAIRAMHSDDVVYEGDLICALIMLASRIALAQASDSDKMVDVVSLSLGYFSDSAADDAVSFPLWQVIEALLGMGVVVVAAAGNYSTSRMFYPAAFAPRTASPGQVPLIGVGALNPNGSQAVFSDGGDWVTAWASGGTVVSTLPTDVNGSRSPELRMPARPASQMPSGVSRPSHREALDPDDYSCGFGVWSGTSFSAPLLAAHIVRSLLEGPADPGSGLVLKPCGKQAMTNRALAALKAMGWPG